MLDNIGLPYSSTNTALTNSATVGTMDGEILISLKEHHTPTPAHVARLRRELPDRFPQLQFFFQPADIVNQVLNFGRQAPIDIRISSFDEDAGYAMASRLARDLKGIAGVVDFARLPSPRRSGAHRRCRPRAGPAIRSGSAGPCRQSGDIAQQQPATRSQLLARPAFKRQLPACRADADLSRQFHPGLMDPPGDGGTAGNRCTAGDGGTEPGAHERHQIRSDEGADR